jgi:Mor family transcriptional regulator
MTTEERNDEIVCLYSEGWNVYELGARFNLSPSTIRRVIRQRSRGT